MLNFIKKYRQGIPIGIFVIVYLLVFSFLEHRNVHSFHIIHTLFDDYVPFCEVFIIPYFLWFPYMFFTVLYFIFRNPSRKECYQLTFNMMFGMTIFLIISYVYPNAHHLRPTEFARDNIFVDAVKFLYRIDTPTNILPSIHVFNSLAMHMAIISSDNLKKYTVLKHFSFILTILIILSTAFLKQHSFVDISMGATLSLAGYLIFYYGKLPARLEQKDAYSFHQTHRKKTSL